MIGKVLAHVDAMTVPAALEDSHAGPPAHWVALVRDRAPHLLRPGPAMRVKPGPRLPHQVHRVSPDLAADSHQSLTAEWQPEERIAPTAVVPGVKEPEKRPWRLPPRISAVPDLTTRSVLPEQQNALTPSPKTRSAFDGVVTRPARRSRDHATPPAWRRARPEAAETADPNAPAEFSVPILRVKSRWHNLSSAVRGRNEKTDRMPNSDEARRTEHPAEIAGPRAPGPAAFDIELEHPPVGRHVSQEANPWPVLADTRVNQAPMWPASRSYARMADPEEGFSENLPAVTWPELPSTRQEPNAGWQAWSRSEERRRRIAREQLGETWNE